MKRRYAVIKETEHMFQERGRGGSVTEDDDRFAYVACCKEQDVKVGFAECDGCLHESLM